MELKLFVAQERSDISPLVMEAIFVSATGKNLKEVLGVTFSPIFLGYKKGRGYFIGVEEAFDNLAKSGIALTKKNPRYVKELIKRFRIESSKLNKYTEKVFQMDLTKKTNKELYDLFQEFYQHSYNTFPYGEPITWALRFDFIKELEEQMKEKVKDSRKRNDYMATLITADEPSFINLEEIELLKIMLEIKKEKQLVELFQESLDKIKERLILEFPTLNNKINEHTRKFCWVPYDNGSILWDKDYFLGVIKDHLIKKIDIKRKISVIEQFTETIYKKKKKIIKELHLDKTLVELFEAVADSGYLLDLKKEKISYSTYHMRKWFEETAKRLNISYSQLNFMTCEEVKKALLKNKINRKTIDDRYNCGVVESRDGIIKSLTTKEARKIFAKVEKNINNATKEIQGVCAQPGTVRGVARILYSARDNDRMQENEILVTSMTTPDYLPAMRKAKGIITDEGGITCHAAIVSREMGTPCIVGTKHATRFLKDGDLIEMHAASGVVRKLN